MFYYIKEKVKCNNVIMINDKALNKESFVNRGVNGKVYNLYNGDCVKVWNDSFVSKERINKIYKFSNLNVSCAAFQKN